MLDAWFDWLDTLRNWQLILIMVWIAYLMRGRA